MVVELQTDWNVPRSQHAIYYRDTKNAERPIDIAMGLFNAASQ